MFEIMQSLIIVGKDKEKINSEIEKIFKDYKISRFDKEVVQPEKQVGISDIRSLQKKIFLRPLSGDKKIVILEAYLGITNDAQNAFLKILEEPPLSTIIIIAANSLDFFLPTILSRCTVLDLNTKGDVNDINAETNIKILKELKKGSISFAMVLAQNNSKDRETTLAFLEGLIITSHDLLESSEDFSNMELKNVLKKLQETYTIIKGTNVAPRFALENLFLSLFG